jgi:hypothetical protein
MNPDGIPVCITEVPLVVDHNRKLQGDRGETASEDYM